MKNGHTIPIGSSVKILSSQHADIHVGAVGVVDCYEGKGYGVSLTSNFTSPQGSKREERVIWFSQKEVEVV